MLINQNAQKVLAARYLVKDLEGKITETPEGMLRRVAGHIASADALYAEQTDLQKVSDDFFQLMDSLDFLPNSPTLMNAGKELGQLSACFVLPVEDSMEAIFEAIKQAALIHKSGGGTGFAFSRLRPQGSSVNSTGGVASGPVDFMRVFNMATEVVKQGGARRGANMGILRVDHPDILEFIDCKATNNEITNFNISVGITNEFMEALKNKGDYELLNPLNKQVTGKLNAQAVFDKIVEAAWKNGEPGIIFLDRLNRDNVVPSQGEIEATNPCGEQPLLPYESCNLGSLNLANMVKDGAVDWDKLGNCVSRAVHFLDNVIDVNKYPLEIIAQTTLLTRKIGLGVMGFGDMLLKLQLPYASDEAVALAEKIMGFINQKAKQASTELAKIRGAFPLFEESVYKNGPKLRNATVTTIAPTGTLSLIAGVSSGIEPIFGYVYIRNILDGAKMLEVNPVLMAELQKQNLDNEDILHRIAGEGTISHIEELPESIRKVFLCAHDISPVWHIKMQAAFQNHIDNAVSKTVNFPYSATKEEVQEVYELAFELGCKGVTIYRDGSRDAQVLNLGQSMPTEIPTEEKVRRPRKRPSVTQGMTERMKIGCGNLYVTVNYDEKGICEVFTNTGKAGGCPSQSEATARLVSIALRSGVDPHTLIDELQGIRCPSTIRMKATHKEIEAMSCPDAMAKVIDKVYDYSNELNGNGIVSPHPVKEKHGHICPECGAKTIHESGCVICRNCGYSKCG